jgi:hypothetical protein
MVAISSASQGSLSYIEISSRITCRSLPVSAGSSARWAIRSASIASASDQRSAAKLK